jgi:hypothetical protein
MVSGYAPEVERFQLIWALQASIGNGSGVAYDPDFFTRPLSIESARLLDQEAHQAVGAFVGSRCKDLMLVSKTPHGQGKLQYQHRVVYDFLSSQRMHSVVDSAVPQHFRAPHFTFHLGISAARQMHECDLYFSKPFLRGSRQISIVVPEQLLLLHTDEYLNSLEGQLDESAMQTCSEIARSMFRRLLITFDQVTRLDGNLSHIQLLSLAVILTGTRRFDLIHDIVRAGSVQAWDHIRSAYVRNEEQPHRGSWLGRTPFGVRQVVSSCGPHAGILNATTSQRTPCYLPCVYTLWIKFPVVVTKQAELKHDEEPVWGYARPISSSRGRQSKLR